VIHDTFNARYGLTRTIQEVENTQDGIREFIISGHSRYVRAGGSRGDGNYFIDFEGGPFIGQGGWIENTYPDVQGKITDVEGMDPDVCVETGKETMNVRVLVDTTVTKADREAAIEEVEKQE